MTLFLNRLFEGKDRKGFLNSYVNMNLICLLHGGGGAYQVHNSVHKMREREIERGKYKTKPYPTMDLHQHLFESPLQFT